MQDVYFISGLGADHRLFQYLELPGVRPRHIRWISPLPNESWASYAGRLLPQIREPRPVLVGMSLGGMMAMELSRLIPVRQVILISSARSFREIPPYFRLLRVFRGHKWLPYRLLVRLGITLGHWLFGTRSRVEDRLLREIIYDTDETFFRWAWQRVATWTFDGRGPAVHIHGDSDRLLPLRYVHADYVIRGGTHLMVLNRAEEVSAILRTLLDQAPAAGAAEGARGWPGPAAGEQEKKLF